MLSCTSDTVTVDKKKESIFEIYIDSQSCSQTPPLNPVRTQKSLGCVPDPSPPFESGVWEVMITNNPLLTVLGQLPGRVQTSRQGDSHAS